jgi:transposase
MVLERTSVGLDVHARSIVAGVIDGLTGEIRSERLAPTSEAVVGWVLSLPGPVAVAYEAGPTGFGLARALAAVGVRCVVVAPSKLERPPGDRVKTDRRDAERLARLLRIGELPVVRVPSVAEEAARDLLRAREDARGDLMRARHRLSKLLLRQGLVWPDSAWTHAHQRWLQRLRWDQPGVRVAFDEALGAVLAVQARRDRLDGPSASWQHRRRGRRWSAGWAACVGSGR